jgi:hypothetical protein
MRFNKAQFWLAVLLYLFVMFDLFVTSIGLDRGVAEANTYLVPFIIHSGSGVFDGFMLVVGGLFATSMMLALCFLVTKIQKVFSMEFFVAMLVLLHFVGILNWIAIL